MRLLLARYATPLTAGLFLVSLISGTALFFHIGTSTFHRMHEWMSIALIVPFALHIWRNWRPMVAYFPKPAFALAMTCSLVAAVVFAVGSSRSTGRSGSPQVALVRALTASTPAVLAPAFGTSAEAIVAALKEHGFESAASDVPLAAMASKAGKSEAALSAALLRAANR